MRTGRNYYKELAAQREKRRINPEYDREKSRRWIRNHPDQKRESSLRWYRQNKEHCNLKARAWYQSNKKRVRAYEKMRRDTNPCCRIGARLRGRICEVLRSSNARKASKTTEMLGCTIPELRAWLESKFKDGMSWQNYGLRGWHIDHIIPCAAFDLRNPDEQLTCFHFTNLQPLWWIDNIRKHTKI